MSISSLLNTTCDIKTQSPSKDGYGAATFTLAVKHSAAPCRVHVMPSDVAAVYAGKFDVTRMRRVYFDADYSIDPVTDWIVWEGVSYQVHAVNDAGGFLGRLFQVDVVEKP